MTDYEQLRGFSREPDIEEIRRDLARQADAVAAVISEAAHRPTRARLAYCAMHLEAVRRLALSYRDRIESHADPVRRDNG